MFFQIAMDFPQDNSVRFIPSVVSSVIYIVMLTMDMATGQVVVYLMYVTLEMLFIIFMLLRLRH